VGEEGRGQGTEQGMDAAQVVLGTERDFVGYGSTPPRVEWPNGARLALTFVINYEEGSEYNFPDGDNRNESHGVSFETVPSSYRNLRVESQYEYGSRAGIWRLMRLFDTFGIKTTFHASAVALERNPAVAEAIRLGGHEPCSHGWRWSDEPWHLSEDEERRRMHLAVESIRLTTGERPLGWYTRYGPGLNTRKLLVEEGGFMYDGNAYNDDLPYFVPVGEERILVLPYNATYNDGRYVGIPRFSKASDFADDCKRAIAYLWEEGKNSPKMTSIALHPRIAGDPGRASALREVIEYALSLRDVWITRRIDVANWWIKQYGS
jgi:peptidoglycan/xylan/chitin deacetylase (PgdA/CDA1 family)